MQVAKAARQLLAELGPVPDGTAPVPVPQTH
jgi:hypothetical protein